MTPELTALAVAILVHMALIGLFAYRANREIGTKYTTSPRDDAPQRPLSIVTGRLQRAVSNSFESLIMFAPAALMVGLTHQSNGWTAFLAWIFVLARIAYIPAYATGLAPGRSGIWGLGFLATLLLVIAALV
ncbi:MAPEG family protein [Acidimangrovimonas sediminis]|uniref:MAPEG family protein n=1 Tax=Acidimangrovimonas sediminis TaxID=2056283 RepID=UPI000C809412|nr:MAPEG family protein [Acidimangrovimonas sediminis]